MALGKIALKGGLAALMTMVMTAGAFAWSAVATTTVNVRSGPGTQYGVVSVLQGGQRVDVDYCRGSWCFISQRGPDGWVSQRYLAPAGSYRPAPPPVYRPAPPPIYRPAPPRPPIYRPGPPRPPVYRPGPHRPPHYQRPPHRPPHHGHRPGSGVRGNACISSPGAYFCFGN